MVVVYCVGFWFFIGFLYSRTTDSTDEFGETAKQVVITVFVIQIVIVLIHKQEAC